MSAAADLEKPISLDLHDRLVDEQARILFNVPSQINFGLSDSYEGGIYEHTIGSFVQLCGGWDAAQSEEYARFDRTSDYSGSHMPFWVAGKFAAVLAYNRFLDGVPAKTTTTDILYTYATSLQSHGIENSRRSGVNAVKHGLRRYLIEDTDSTESEVLYAYKLTSELDRLQRSDTRKTVLGATVLAGATAFAIRKLGV